MSGLPPIDHRRKDLCAGSHSLREQEGTLDQVEQQDPVGGEVAWGQGAAAAAPAAEVL